MKNAIAINIIDFNIFDCEEYHSTFKIFEEHRKELLTDKFRIDFLELRKAKEYKLSSESPIMKKAVAVLRQMSVDEKELYEIEQREKAVRDERQQGKNEIISKMKKSGMSDEQIQKNLLIQ